MYDLLRGSGAEPRSPIGEFGEVEISRVVFDLDQVERAYRELGVSQGTRPYVTRNSFADTIADFESKNSDAFDRQTALVRLQSQVALVVLYESVVLRNYAYPTASDFMNREIHKRQSDSS